MLMSTERPYHFTSLFASLNEIFLKSDFVKLFHDLMHIYSHGAGGLTAYRGRSFDVKRNFLSLC